MRIDLPQMDLPKGERGATGSWNEDNVAAILSDEFFGWQEVSHIKRYTGDIYNENETIQNYGSFTWVRGLWNKNTIILVLNSPSKEIISSTNNGASWSTYGLGLNTPVGLWQFGDNYIVMADALCAYSTDGVNWATTSNGNINFRAATTNGSLFVYVQPDRINWTATPGGGLGNSVSLNNCVDIVWDGTQFLACQATTSNTPVVITAPSLPPTWTARLTATVPSAKTIAYLPIGSRYICGGGDVFYTSSNGLSWTLLTGHGMTGINKIIAGTTGFVAVGTSGIYKSPDGITWMKVSDATNFNYVWQTADGNVSGASNTANGQFFKIDGGVTLASWQYAPLKYWDGSDWKTRYLKRWNGSEWVIEKG